MAGDGEIIKEKLTRSNPLEFLCITVVTTVTYIARSRGARIMIMDVLHLV